MLCLREENPSPWRYLPNSFFTTEQTLRLEQQDDDQDGEGTHVLDVRGNPQRGDLDQDADNDGSDEGAECGTETAEHDCREHEQQDLPAHVPLDAWAEVGPQHTGETGQNGSEDPDQPDHTVNVDTGGLGQRWVVGDRARRLTRLGLQQP